MPRRAACFVIGLIVVRVAWAAEPAASSEKVSPVRQHLRDTIKAKVLQKPADAPSPQETKPADQPIMLPAFVVEDSREKQERRALSIVNGHQAMEDRLSYRPLYKTERVEILRRPRMDDLPPRNGMERWKLDIFNLKW